jgi:lipopolysaccharide transport system permease protein
MRKENYIIRPEGTNPIRLFYELWLHRGFVLFFIKRFIRSMFGQTFVGPIWLAVGPLTSAIAITFMFTSVVQMPSDNIPYIMFYLTGAAFFSFCSSFALMITRKLKSSRRLMNALNFPRLLSAVQVITFPLSELASSILSLFIVIGFYLIKEGHAYVQLSPKLLLLPIVLFLGTLFALSFGMVFGSLNCITRDIRFIAPHLIKLLTYLSPVFYPISTISQPWKGIMIICNPMAIMTEAVRWSLFGVGEFTSYINYFFMHTGIIIGGFIFCLMFFEKAMQFIIERT